MAHRMLFGPLKHHGVPLAIREGSIRGPCLGVTLKFLSAHLSLRCTHYFVQWPHSSAKREESSAGSTAQRAQRRERSAESAARRAQRGERSAESAGWRAQRGEHRVESAGRRAQEDSILCVGAEDATHRSQCKLGHLRGGVKQK